MAKKGPLSILCSRTKVREIMSKPAVTIHQDDNFSDAERLFVAHRLYYLPVIDDGDRLVGLISHKYLYKTQSPRKIGSEEMDYDPNIIVDGDTFYEKETLDAYILRYIMMKNPFSLKEDNTAMDAIHAMAKQNLSCIPIVDDKKKVIGVLTKEDLIKFASGILDQDL